MKDNNKSHSRVLRRKLRSGKSGRERKSNAKEKVFSDAMLPSFSSLLLTPSFLAQYRKEIMKKRTEELLLKREEESRKEEERFIAEQENERKAREEYRIREMERLSKVPSAVLILFYLEPVSFVFVSFLVSVFLSLTIRHFSFSYVSNVRRRRSSSRESMSAIYERPKKRKFDGLTL